MGPANTIVHGGSMQGEWLCATSKAVVVLRLVFMTRGRGSGVQVG